MGGFYDQKRAVFALFQPFRSFEKVQNFSKKLVFGFKKVGFFKNLFEVFRIFLDFFEKSFDFLKFLLKILNFCVIF